MREVAIIGVCAAVLGGVLGFAVPVSAAVTGHVYLAEMLPPSGNTYQLVQLNCGWHTGACDSPSESGINLDWDNTSTYNVSFRGWFTRTGAPDNETIRLDGIVAQVSGGQYACEDWKIDVVETYTSAARFAMHYLHVYLSSGNFAITTGNAASNDRVIGYMVWD